MLSLVLINRQRVLHSNGVGNIDHFTIDTVHELCNAAVYLTDVFIDILVFAKLILAMADEFFVRPPWTGYDNNSGVPNSEVAFDRSHEGVSVDQS